MFSAPSFSRPLPPRGQGGLQDTIRYREGKAWAAVAAILLIVGGCGPASRGPSEPPKSAAQLRVEKRIRFSIARMRDTGTALPAMKDLMAIGGPAVPFLLQALNDNSYEIRLGASLVIQHIANVEYGSRKTFGYGPDAPLAQRQRGVREIEDWWQAHKGAAPDGGVQGPESKVQSPKTHGAAKGAGSGRR